MTILAQCWASDVLTTNLGGRVEVQCRSVEGAVDIGPKLGQHCVDNIDQNIPTLARCWANVLFPDNSGIRL